MPEEQQPEKPKPPKKRPARPESVPKFEGGSDRALSGKQAPTTKGGKSGGGGKRSGKKRG